MALTRLVRRTWERLFGGWWDGVPEPPIVTIQQLVRSGYLHYIDRETGESKPPPEWAVALCCNVWRHGFEAGYEWSEKDYERMLGPPDEQEGA
jgi:hypothetical protein